VLRHAPGCWIRRAIQKSTRLSTRPSDALPASGVVLPEAKERWTIDAIRC
jgi:hypothetical protein